MFNQKFECCEFEHKHYRHGFAVDARIHKIDMMKHENDIVKFIFENNHNIGLDCNDKCLYIYVNNVEIYDYHEYGVHYIAKYYNGIDKDEA